METRLLEAARKLPVDERVDLVEAIWDSIAEEAGMLPLTPEQRALLDARLLEHRQAPDAGEAWEVLRKRLVAAR